MNVRSKLQDHLGKEEFFSKSEENNLLELLLERREINTDIAVVLKNRYSSNFTSTEVQEALDELNAEDELVKKEIETILFAEHYKKQQRHNARVRRGI